MTHAALVGVSSGKVWRKASNSIPCTEKMPPLRRLRKKAATTTAHPHPPSGGGGGGGPNVFSMAQRRKSSQNIPSLSPQLREMGVLRWCGEESAGLEGLCMDIHYVCLCIYLDSVPFMCYLNKIYHLFSEALSLLAVVVHFPPVRFYIQFGLRRACR